TVGDGFLFGLPVRGSVSVIDLRPSTGPEMVGSYEFIHENILDIAYEQNILYAALDNHGIAALRLNLDD
ncbi:MAG: hypothetical protein WAM60_01695, partial [Candidatus Promineifilaceae bacterium]